MTLSYFFTSVLLVLGLSSYGQNEDFGNLFAKPAKETKNIQVDQNEGIEGERALLNKQPIENPVQDIGHVMVELIVDRLGNVISCKALLGHNQTTTTNPIHFKEAEKLAKEWKFSKDPDAPEKEKIYKSIYFEMK